MSRRSSISILIALTIIWAAAFAVVTYYNFKYSMLYILPFCFILILFYGQFYKNYNLSYLYGSDHWMLLMVALLILIVATVIVYVVYQVEFILIIILFDIAIIFAAAFRLSDRIKNMGSPSKKWFLAVTSLMIVVYLCFLLMPEMYNISAALRYWPLPLILLIYANSIPILPK